MPRYGIQPSFAGGEFAPSLWARVDLQKYATGLRTAKNFIVHPHGGASNRPGLLYAATTKTAGKAVRLVPFEFSTEQAYVIEFGDGYCRFYMNGGQIAVTPAEVTAFDPSAAHAAGVFTKCGRYRALDCGSGRTLTVAAPYGDLSTTVDVAVASNVGDTMTVVWSSPHIAIGLANATPAKNAANLIQAALRAADPVFASWTVTENAAYAASRPTTGVSDPAALMTPCDQIYYCISAAGASASNTNYFPPLNLNTKWAEQTAYEIPSDYIEAELFELKFAQSADVLYICHPDHPPMQLERSGHTSWTFSEFAYSGGPFMASNATAKTITASALTGSVTLTASSALFDEDHVGALFRLRHPVPGGSVTQAFAAPGVSSSIKAGSTWRIITHGTWTATLKIEQSIDNGSTWTELRGFSGANDFNANTYGDVEDFCLIRLNCTAHTSGTLNVDLTSDPYDHTGIAEVTAYTNATTVTATVIDALGLTTATSDWAEGAWSNWRGWPSCCTFFEDRLAFASTPTEPQTIWMSETGYYTSFARSEPLVDSDGITVNLPSRKMNAIRSMLPLKAILVLTSASEWTVGPGPDGLLTPTSIQTEINGYRGCSDAEPVIVGNQAIFVQPKGSVVRDLGYDYTSEGFAGANISIISNHLFTNHRIVGMAFQQEPDSLVWAVREDGVLLSMTYLREHEVIAWTRHETDGLVESICSIPGDTYDEVWVSVKRGTARFIERLSERMTSTDPRRQIFLDAAISYDDPKTITAVTLADPAVFTSAGHGFTNGQQIDILDAEGLEDSEGESLVNGLRFTVANAAANTFELLDEDGDALDASAASAYVSGGEARLVAASITGLDHLEGRTVSILADGCVHVPKTVSGGAVTLDAPASLVHVGLPYESDLETLNIELPQRDGTTQGRKIRVSAVTLRFLNSRGGFLGPADDSLHEIVQRANEPLGSPTALFTGDFSMNISSDYESGGRVFYRQADPLPVTILAVMPVFAGA